MKAVIGNQLIKTLKPGPKSYDVRDTRLPGFVLRVLPSGTMTYLANYARGKHYTIGKASVLTPVQAREEARNILAAVVRGVDPMAEKKASKAYTLKTFIEKAYGPWVMEHRKWGKATVARLHYCFSGFAGKKLNEVTAWDVEKWRSTELKAGRKATGINRDLDDIKALMAKSVEWKILTSNPIATVKRMKVDRSPKVRFLDQSEETRLRDALIKREMSLQQERRNANSWRRERGYTELPALKRDHLRPMVLLAMNTGLRRGELFHLRWKEVDLERALLTIRGEISKSGVTRYVPLNAEAQEVLMNWRPLDLDSKELVFPGRNGNRLDNINSAWRGLIKLAEITAFRFHDLRHHFASRLVQEGVNLNTVRELLGHSDIKMTLKYAHLAPKHMAAAVEKLVWGNEQSHPIKRPNIS